MNYELYDMIFKRKSFHLFRNTGDEIITSDELVDIEKYFYSLVPLVDNIKVKIRITKDTSCKRGQEYCIVIYSEIKDNYLQNIGYLGEQLDLYLVSKNIGTLWFGIGKPDENVYEDLPFVIMMAIKKVNDSAKFRKDMFKAKRKNIEEIWTGNKYKSIANIVRFAPSACNLQPWKVEENEDELKIYRYKKPGIRGIMPINKVVFYNRIDIGIFLCFLEQCLYKENIKFERKMYNEDGVKETYNLTAIYKLN